MTAQPSSSRTISPERCAGANARRAERRFPDLPMSSRRWQVPLAPGQYAQAGADPGPASAAPRPDRQGHLGRGDRRTRHTADGVTVNLADGDPVFQGDVVQTGTGLQARHLLHRRYRLLDVRRCAHGARRAGLRSRQRRQQLDGRQPCPGLVRLRHRPGRADRQHEGRDAGRDDGHPRNHAEGSRSTPILASPNSPSCPIPAAARSAATF